VQKLDVVLRGCYLFRDMPFLRVTCIDESKAFEVVNQNPFGSAAVSAKQYELTYDPATERRAPLVIFPITEPVSEYTCRLDSCVLSLKRCWTSSTFNNFCCFQCDTLYLQCFDTVGWVIVSK